MSKSADQHYRIYGDESKRFKISSIPEIIFGYHLVYLLHAVFLINYFKSWDINWIVLYFLVFIIYYILPIPFYLLKSYKELKYFFYEFLSEEAKFKLVHFKDLELKVNNESKISRVTYRNKSKEEPILSFVAKPRGLIPMSQTKAYLNQFGQSFLIHRSFDITSPFEKFMIYHELEHLNDRGIVNDKAIIRMKVAFIIHITILIIILKGMIPFIILTIYSLMMFGQRFGQFEVTREIIADNRAIQKLTSEEKETVIPILIHIWKSNHSKAEKERGSKSLNRMLRNKARIEAIESYKFSSKTIRTHFGMLNEPVAYWSILMIIGVIISKYNCDLLQILNYAIFLLMMFLLALVSILITYTLYERKVKHELFSIMNNQDNN